MTKIGRCRVDILLINSPIFQNQSEDDDDNVIPSLGLAYIASSLEAKGNKCEIYNAIKFDCDTTVDYINSKSPKYVGMNVFSINYELVCKIIESINPNITVIVGGPGIASLYKFIHEVQTSNIVITISGDGEKIVPEILGCQNLLKLGIKISENRFHIIVDKDSQYFVKDISESHIDRKFLPEEPLKHNKKGINEAFLVSSRGCVHACAFCTASRKQNPYSLKIRSRSQESIISEINDIVKKYGSDVNCIRVLDDLFLRNKTSFHEAIDIFDKFKLKWRAMVHVNALMNVNEEILKNLKQCGCFELEMGIESGSDRVLKMINKHKSKQRIIEKLTLLFETGIQVKAYFIFGFPDETIEEMEETYKLCILLNNLAKNLGCGFSISAFKFRLYYGTELFNNLFA